MQNSATPMDRRQALACGLTLAGMAAFAPSFARAAEAPSAAPGWKQSVHNPMLSLGAPGSFDHHNIYAPCVVKVDSRYYMFYSGGPSGPPEDENFLNYQLGLALSEDGEHWIKTGKPLLPLGERDNLHVAPALLRHPVGTLCKEGGLWHMIYNGNRADDVELATSRDGLTWEKDPKSPIFKNAYAPCLLKMDGEYRLYYTRKVDAAGKGMPWEIHLATGKDLHALSPHPANPMLKLSQSWERTAIIYPYVIREADTWVLFYASYWAASGRKGILTAIGQATGGDGIHWKKDEANPIVKPTEGSPFDSMYTSSQCVIKDGDKYRMYYGARIDMVHKYYAIGQATKAGRLVP